MLERKIIQNLLSWKNNGSQKALIVTGARQVGKTFIIREFGKQYYSSFIELNFLMDPFLKSIFEGRLDAETILPSILLAFPGKHLIPGDTLIFLDEIQDCPNAITALKFLLPDKRFDIICSGSALGMAYNRTSSFPVGSVDYLDMFSLDFEEFLWALGLEKDLIAQVRNYYDTKTVIPTAVNDQMMKYLRQYMAIGGMPEVVDQFIQTKDYVEADNAQRRIYRDYLADIARYARAEIKIKAENCYRSIPAQLNKQNHKFQYKLVENKGTARKFESSLDWLINAHMAIPCTNVSYVEYPLKTFESSDSIRLYPNDIGLLICTYDLSLKEALLRDTELNKPSDNLVLRTAKGGIWEALVAEMLTKSGHQDLHFHRNESGTAEIEFLIENADGVIPIEVKAGKSKTKTLTNLLQKEQLPYGYKLSSQNLGVDGKKITLPVYMAMWV